MRWTIGSRLYPSFETQLWRFNTRCQGDILFSRLFVFTNNESHVESNPRWKIQEKNIKVWLLLVFGIFTVFVVNLWLPGSGLDLALFPASQLFPLGLKFNSVPMEKVSRLAKFCLTFFYLTHFFGKIILFGFEVFAFFSSTLCLYVIEISLKQHFHCRQDSGISRVEEIIKISLIIHFLDILLYS